MILVVIAVLFFDWSHDVLENYAFLLQRNLERFATEHYAFMS